MTAQFKYLVYDIESVINKSLLNRVLYAGKNLTDNAAYQAHIKELAEEGKDFVNPSFHKPIAIAAVAVGEDYTINKIGLLGGDNGKRTTASIVRHFWEIYNSRDKPVLVDFYGRSYDIRVLELWAFQLGIAICFDHFKKFGTRYRFADEHIDLHDFLTNYSAVKFRGGLDLFSKLLGKPGKMGTKGDMVQELYEQEKFFQIDDYCLCDTMDTYFVFLRTRVMLGKLDLQREKELVDLAKKAMIEKNKAEGYFVEYLENFGDWEPME